MSDLVYVCDDGRHLICVPYTVENLHRMARDLKIKPCRFHWDKRHPYYEIPKRRVTEIKRRCLVVSSRTLLSITQRMPS